MKVKGLINIRDEAKELDEIRVERDRAYDTINEQLAELDEIRAERDKAYLKRDIAEDKVKEVEQTRDILAYENRSLAEFIKHNDSTLTDSDVGDIACGAPDVWDSFINESANRMLEQNNSSHNNKGIKA